MIDKVLGFIGTQINNYLHVKMQDPSNAALITVDNIAWNDNNTGGSAGGGSAASNAFITLVNIEEDRISRSQENYVRQAGIVQYRQPKVHLNLYVLFAANLSVYTESLKRLSYIIQFFQAQNVFTLQNTPSLPPPIKELIFDLITLGFQDLNNLWGILGSKYLPSVIYKVRLVPISEEFSEGDAPLLHEIIVNDKLLQNQ